MPTTQSTIGPLRAFGAIAAAGILLLAGCAKEPQTPPIYINLGTPSAAIDTEAALSLINDYRRKEGVPPLVLDPALTAIAQEQADSLAANDNVRLSLDADRRIDRRLAAEGYAADSAVENVSAGYRTLAEAFSGWRELKGQNANMLNAQADRFGIATAYSSTSKYRVFWAAIFAHRE